MSVLKEDGCAVVNENISASDCVVTPKLIKKIAWATNQNYELPLATAIDEALFKDEIANGKIFISPIILDVRESTINGVQVAQDNSGNTQVTRESQSVDITFGIEIGYCMLKKAKSWNGRKLQVWALDESNRILGYLTTNNAGDEVLKGNSSKLVFDTALPYQVSIGEIVYVKMRWIVDKDIYDQAIQLPFEVTTLDGIVDVKIAVPTATGASVVISVTEGCNGTGVEGLEAADLVFKNAAGVTQVPTGVTDNGNGSYTAAFSPSLSAATYSVNLSAATIEISGSSAIYGALATAKSFTIS